MFQKAALDKSNIANCAKVLYFSLWACHSSTRSDFVSELSKIGGISPLQRDDRLPADGQGAAFNPSIGSRVATSADINGSRSISPKDFLTSSDKTIILNPLVPVASKPNVYVGANVSPANRPLS